MHGRFFCVLGLRAFGVVVAREDCLEPEPHPEKKRKLAPDVDIFMDMADKALANSDPLPDLF
tara:strand:- start:1289 stop:1474 length:186 start_codon:yes stop_codon:yes gene_type:complete